MRYFAFVALLLIASLPVVGQENGRSKPAVSPETMALYEPGEFKGVQYRLMKPKGNRL